MLGGPKPQQFMQPSVPQKTPIFLIKPSSTEAHVPDFVQRAGSQRFRCWQIAEQGKTKRITNLIKGIEGLEQKFVALFHKDAPAAATLLKEIATGAQEVSAVAAAAGSSNKAITALGKVAGIAEVGAQFLATEATATNVNQVGSALTTALSEVHSTGVVGAQAQTGLDDLGAKVTAVTGVLANIAATPAEPAQ